MIGQLEELQAQGVLLPPTGERGGVPGGGLGGNVGVGSSGGGGVQEGEEGEEPELAALRGASAEMEMRVS